MTPTALSSALWSVELDGAKRRASQRQSEERIEDDQTHQSDSNQALALNNDDDTQSIMTFETYSTWDAASRLSDHGTLGCDRLSIVPVNMLASITEEESVPRFYDPSKVLTEMNLRITKTWEFIVSLQRDMDNEDQAELDALKMILGRLTDNTLDQVSQWCLGSSTRQPKELKFLLPIIDILWDLQTTFLASISKIIETHIDRSMGPHSVGVDSLHLMGLAASHGLIRTLVRRHHESQKRLLFTRKDTREEEFKFPSMRKWTYFDGIELQFCALAIALQHTKRDLPLKYISCPCCGMKVPRLEKHYPLLSPDPWRWPKYEFSSQFLIRHHLEQDASGASKKYEKKYGCAYCDVLSLSSTFTSVEMFAMHLVQEHENMLKGMKGVTIGAESRVGEADYSTSA